MTALSYLVKMGKKQGTKQHCKGKWGISDFEGDHHTQNTQEDWESSRNIKDASKWKLCTQGFAKITKLLEYPSVDLFTA